MTRRFPWAALALGGLAFLLAGCAAGTRHAQVRPPATVAPQAQAVDLTGLPLSPGHSYPKLVPAMRPAIDVLIEQVERDFQQGEAEYQADNLPRAKEHFDEAMNRLLKSGLKFTADPRLEPLMDRLVTAMHNDQVQVSEPGAAGTGLPQQSEVAENPSGPSSPLEEIAAAANLPSNPEVGQKATAELLHIPHDLPLTVNKPVLTFLNFFQTRRGREIIEHSLARSGRYMPMVQKILKQEGVPQDLKYLPLCESGYQPRAMSRVGARGMWQFMPMRAREYGLKINRWEDQRMDPEDSTRAAAEHLRDLYGMFHDWYLALAAYDAGPLTVTRAIERTGYADFWQLYRLNALPLETKNYVPIMLAMTLAAKDPSLYGIDVTDPEKPVHTEPFKPGRSIDLRLVADAIGVSVKSLRNLNPALFGVITPDDPTYVLHLPAHTRSRLEATLASIPPSHWVGWRLHRVEDGETLGTIAAKYHMRPASLAAVNNVPADDPLSPGRLLLVPAPVLPALIYYRVRRGDTVGGIAERFHVSIYDLRIWNHLRSNLIRIRQVLRIYTRQGRRGRYEEVSRRRPARSSYDSRGRGRGGIYIARPGDSFWSIARRFGTSVRALRDANPEIARRGLKIGERVVIPR